MKQPLVIRPPYGSSRGPVGESKLPSGDPGGRGLSLDDDIPGTRTFSKPEGDIREEKHEDSSMYRVDEADDLTKDQTRPDEIDHSEDDASFNGLGEDDTPKTKYPYRDDRPNTHNASMVVELHLVRTAHEIVIRTATRLEAIEEGVNPKFVDRGKSCNVSLKRADIPNLRWLFAVDCGNGPKVVRVKASRTGKVVQMSKLDLHASCSCPAWRWLGPEHHSKREDYLDGKPRGTASVPVIRDPEGVNRVCKHVAAVLGAIRKWQVPSAKRDAVKQVMKKEMK